MSRIAFRQVSGFGLCRLVRSCRACLDRQRASRDTPKTYSARPHSALPPPLVPPAGESARSAYRETPAPPFLRVWPTRSSTSLRPVRNRGIENPRTQRSSLSLWRSREHAPDQNLFLSSAASVGWTLLPAREGARNSPVAPVGFLPVSATAEAAA